MKFFLFHPYEHILCHNHLTLCFLNLAFYGNSNPLFHCKVGFYHPKEKHKVSFKLFCACLCKWLCLSCWEALARGKKKEFREDSNTRQHCRLSMLLKCPCRHYTPVWHWVKASSALLWHIAMEKKCAVSPEMQVVFVALVCGCSSINSAV